MKVMPELSAVDVHPFEWKGPSCAETSASAQVIPSSSSWETLWRERLGRTDAPPPVDFGSYVAVAVFLGSRNTGGYSIEFLDPMADDADMRVRYKVRAPAPGGFVTQAFTQPYAIRLYPKTSRKISIVEER